MLPVLPVVLTTSAARPSSRARPFAVVGGLVLSFGAATLVGGAVLGALGLPQDLLRWLGVAALALVGLALLWPRLGDLLEAPFRRVRGPRPDRDGNGFVLGLGMGLVFVPCAGPILASISVLAATERLGPGLVALTAAYCVGVAIPLLVVAFAGTGLARRSRAVREHAHLLRTVAGAVLVAAGAAMLFRRTAVAAIAAVGVLMTLLTIGLFAPDLMLAQGVTQQVTAINFVADTLLFAGMIYAPLVRTPAYPDLVVRFSLSTGTIVTHKSVLVTVTITNQGNAPANNVAVLGKTPLENLFGGADPIVDLRTFEEDLLLADLDIVSGRVHRLEESAKKPRPKDAIARSDSRFWISRSRIGITGIPPFIATQCRPPAVS